MSHFLLRECYFRAEHLSVLLSHCCSFCVWDVRVCEFGVVCVVTC